ncbi:MAG: peptidoglycan-binding protein [Candidatus Fimimorpha sp.]
MADYNNSLYTYEEVLAGKAYYKKDDQLRYSDGVKTMQTRLNTVGYNCGTPDGKFGSNTEIQVTNFQIDHGLTHDGLAGKDTLTKLNSVVASTSGNVTAMRNRIKSEALYWENKIPYCINSIVTTRLLDKTTPPPYMDCSDFSSSVYLTVLGINIGATTSVQINRGVAVPKSSMKPGDLVLFDWDGDGSPNHVGIYYGDNYVIDEHGTNSNPNSFVPGENVRKLQLTSYYMNKILSVRRILQDDGSIIN